MQNSGFFNSVNGDRRYKAEFFAEYFASFIGNGVFPNPSTGLQLMANNDMTVTVKAGKGWINGYYYINNDDLILNIDIADGVLSRIDRIVLQYNTADRTIVAKVKKGTFASSPVVPELQRDADAYELGIADIYVAAGATKITQPDITDLRLNTELCGIVHGTVEQVDTTTLFNQYFSWYTQTTGQAITDLAIMKQQFQNDFNNWFVNVQDTLDENTAGNLFNLINNLAGAGRTTETVKSNADAIVNLTENLNSRRADINESDIVYEEPTGVDIVDFIKGADCYYMTIVSGTGYKIKKLDLNFNELWVYTADQYYKGNLVEYGGLLYFIRNISTSGSIVKLSSDGQTMTSLINLVTNCIFYSFFIANNYIYVCGHNASSSSDNLYLYSLTGTLQYTINGVTKAIPDKLTSNIHAVYNNQYNGYYKLLSSTGNTLTTVSTVVYGTDIILDENSNPIIRTTTNYGIYAITPTGYSLPLLSSPTSISIKGFYGENLYISNGVYLIKYGKSLLYIEKMFPNLFDVFLIDNDFIYLGLHDKIYKVER